MTANRFEQQVQTVHAALTNQGGKVTTVDRGVWELYPESAPAGPSFEGPVEVRLGDDWVVCRSLLPPGLNGDFEAYALATPSLPGRCKVALDPARRTPCLREEILSVEGVDLALACGSAIANLASAGAVLTGAKERFASDGGTVAVGAGVAETLAEVCVATGWTCTGYGEGDAHEIILASARGGRHATAYAWGAGGVRVTASLSRLKDLTGTSRRGAAALALAANGMMRVVRAGFAADAAADGDTRPFFEARFAKPPEPEVLGFALSTFAAAIGTFDREFDMMADVKIARRYLETRGLEDYVTIAEAVAS